MCLLLLALNPRADRPWLLLGNRDEFHARPTAPMQAWAEVPDVIGGRDLLANGSWLAVHRSGRYAAVTNVRQSKPLPAPRSRGDLVREFVCGDAAPSDYTREVAERSGEYGPFNLIAGVHADAWGASSIGAQHWRFAEGVHALSNGSREDLWPKMRRLRERFHAAARLGKNQDDDLLDLLGDVSSPDESQLPDTGVGLEFERMLAPIFIRGAAYGTRASTLAYAHANGNQVLIERRFGPDGVRQGESRFAR